MMGAKGTRNAAIALIILGLGIYLIRQISQGFVGEQAPIQAPGLAEFIESARGIFNISLYAIGALVVLLIIIYIAQRRGEKKEEAEPPPAYPEEVPEGEAPEAPAEEETAPEEEEAPAEEEEGEGRA